MPLLRLFVFSVGAAILFAVDWRIGVGVTLMFLGDLTLDYGRRREG